MVSRLGIVVRNADTSKWIARCTRLRHPRGRSARGGEVSRPHHRTILPGVAAALAVAPHHDPKTAAASVAVVLLPLVRRLTGEQLEVMVKLHRLTHGSVYRRGASIEELRRHIFDALKRAQVTQLRRICDALPTTLDPDEQMTRLFDPMQ